MYCLKKRLFLSTIDGKTCDGVVQDKEEAQQQYSQAVSRGESAENVRYRLQTYKPDKLMAQLDLQRSK